MSWPIFFCPVSWPVKSAFSHLHADATLLRLPPVMDNHVHEFDFQTLIDGCRANRRDCQYRLHGQFFNYAMTVARRYSGNSEAAEEVANDAFFKAFTRLGQFQPSGQSLEGSFRAWFRRVIINTAIDRLRSEKHLPKTTEFDLKHDYENDPGLPDHLTFQQIMGMLDQLPPAYRTVFNLHVGDGFTHEEIAETLGISVGSSKSNLSRARQHVRRLLEGESFITR